ncbi:MAG: hypothetical protein ACREDR_27700, partial [Blastocatellia bacterium]
MQRWLSSYPLVLSVTILMAATVTFSRPGHATPANDVHEAQDGGLAALEQTILDISNPFSVLNLAVRPGEEDTGALVYCRRKLGIRTGVVFATDSSITDCDGSRSETLMNRALEAAGRENAETYFLNLPWAGASNTEDAVLSVWNHDAALAKLVGAIRDFRPDVITTTASASSNDLKSLALTNLLIEALPKAADPTQFSDSNLAPWSVARVFVRSSGKEPTAIQVNLNEFDPIHGASYLTLAESARESYGGHGPALSATAGYNLIYPVPSNKPDESEKPAPPQSFLDGIALPKEVASALAPPTVGGTPLLQALGQRTVLLDSLVGPLALKQVLGAGKDPHAEFGDQYFRVNRFTNNIQKAVALLLGLQFRLTLNKSVIVPGETFAATLSLFNGSDQTFP